jgi:hypothetical protein
MFREQHITDAWKVFIRPIKNGLVIVLATTIFLHATHLGELSKTPYLFVHFSEHLERHPKDSLFDFLYKHYISNQQADSEPDHNSDKQMPFKTHVFHFDLSPFILADQILAIPIVQWGLIEFPTYGSRLLFRAYETWHPPRIG